MNVIFGMSASSSIGIGKAFILPEVQERVIPKRKINESEIQVELDRFRSAAENVHNQIESSLKSLDEKNLQRVIFETYILMVTDPVFLEEVETALKAELFNIEHILNIKTYEYADRLRNSGNDYLAERAKDIEDVFERVQDILLDYHPFNIEEVPDGSVIVASSMRPSDAVILGKRRIAGIALVEGGATSHVAILARSYGIPAVVGIENINSFVDGELVVVDGDLGEVVTSPDEAALKGYQTKIIVAENYRKSLEKFKDLPGRTEDGTDIKILANIGTVEEAQIASDEGADGIGLFRTEFLFMRASKELADCGGSLSSKICEDIQFEAYKRVLEIMDGKPVTIRTLDAGGDKILSSKEIPLAKEKNPLMGLRAIRMSLFYPKVFRTQLRALYRASVYGNMKIMIPLVTEAAQMETVMGLARAVQMDLKSEGIPFNPDVPIGAMIETAAAAICSDCLASRCAFFSLGTNDLTQYTIGIDRENPSVASYYNEFNLSVLRLIQTTIDNAKKCDIPISACGEMAGKKESAITLIGMGLRSLSMAPKQIPVIKETISQFTIQELENISSGSVY